MLQRNWQTLIKPKQLAVEPGDDPKRVATVVAEPLERGFGLTLGNALRRVLLSSLQGAAITSMQIEGVLHEFSSLPGVLEDVTDIVLNVKSIDLRMYGDVPKKMRLRANGPGEVRAGAIETGHDSDIMNPDLVICTLDAGAKIAMELTVEIGKGYVPATPCVCNCWARSLRASSDSTSNVSAGVWGRCSKLSHRWTRWIMPILSPSRRPSCRPSCRPSSWPSIRATFSPVL